MTYCRQYFFDAPIRVIDLPEIHHDKISFYLFDALCHDDILSGILQDKNNSLMYI